MCLSAYQLVGLVDLSAALSPPQRSGGQADKPSSKFIRILSIPAPSPFPFLHFAGDPEAGMAEHLDRASSSDSLP